MDPCPDCGETRKLLHAGTTTSFLVVAIGLLDPYAARRFERTECAGCGRLLSQESEPLDLLNETLLWGEAPVRVLN